MRTNGSLYFHIPFCTKKCPYCHFYVVKDNASLKKRFLAALKKEWEQKLHLLDNVNIVSIYLGGGTPSLLSVDELAFLLSFLPISKDIEVTLEGNPESLSLPYLKEIKSLGVNRLSIGVQSFHNPYLEILGRTHNSSKAIQTILDAHEAGLKNISIDLMYDLPDQTVFSFQESLKTALSLPITHLSLYNLTIEPFTPFYRQKELLMKKMPSEKISLELLDTALHLLAPTFTRYEISAFAKPGYESRHNTGYWTYRPFLGYGPSAFSYFNNSRFSNIASLPEYEKRMVQDLSPINFSETLSPDHHFCEKLAIRLRYFAPFSLEEIGKNIPDGIIPLLTKLRDDGLINFDNTICSLTEKGRYFYDTIAEQIL